MSFSDEILMAYADGELDEATRRALEEAMRKDASLARRVAQHKALRTNVFAAYAPVAEEAVPPRLVRPLRQATVVSLDSVRAKREAEHQAARKARQKRRWSWPEWGALAAMLVVGVVAGKFGLSAWQLDNSRAGETIASRDGSLSAQGRLATALDNQLTSAGAAGPVKIGLSFVAQDGGYCRSFITGNGGQELSGLACKANGEWRIPILVQNNRAPAQGPYRLAAAEMPTPVLEAIDQRINGAALDGKGETDAIQKGWQK
ncbi:anti-sigma factor family protein [Pseudoduganella sp. RAF53_2]|jgi:hypothetical protein|uniref:anti-sigma factor family protein n=1 Tax=Pseudoduganella sp. RAF53_2 TaxID=3233060 RepID=UPI003F949CC8